MRTNLQDLRKSSEQRGRTTRERNLASSMPNKFVYPKANSRNHGGMATTASDGPRMSSKSLARIGDWYGTIRLVRANPGR